MSLFYSKSVHLYTSPYSPKLTQDCVRPHLWETLENYTFTVLENVDYV